MPVEKPDRLKLMLGQSHFIETVEERAGTNGKTAALTKSRRLRRAKRTRRGFRSRTPPATAPYAARDRFRLPGAISFDDRFDHSGPSGPGNGYATIGVRWFAARGGRCIARMVRKPAGVRLTSDAALLLCSGIGLLVRHAGSSPAGRGGLLVPPG